MIRSCWERVKLRLERHHPPRFRHDTARRLVEQVDLPTAAALLGHSRLDTISIYSQPDQDALRRAADLLEQTSLQLWGSPLTVDSTLALFGVGTDGDGPLARCVMSCPGGGAI